ncbi:MAG TPA: hypothetical protein VFW53_05235, partial [Gallionella sp.]|nr:hypothetical protein [Gallionella sp.]
SNTIQPLYGSNKMNFPVPPGNSLMMNVYGVTGISDTYEIGDLKAHAAYMKMKFDVITTIPGIALTANPYSTWTVGANYDPGDWYASAEYLKARDNAYGTAYALMLGAGYRIGTWTPYVFRSTQHVQSLGRFGDAGTGTKPGDEQVATGLGIRWDFYKNMDFKLQYEQVKTGPIAMFFPITVPPATIQPNFLNHPTINAVTAVVDFVF